MSTFSLFLFFNSHKPFNILARSGYQEFTSGFHIARYKFMSLISCKLNSLISNSTLRSLIKQQNGINIVLCLKLQLASIPDCYCCQSQNMSLVCVKHLTCGSSAAIDRCHRVHIFLKSSKLDKRINLVKNLYSYCEKKSQLKRKILSCFWL